MASIEILAGGLFTTVQDLGRPSGSLGGFPWGGVMDRRSAKYANSLISNSSVTALLEITLIGPKIRFEDNRSIAITGADLSPSINNRRIYNDTLITINKGDVLSFGKTNSGCRAYLAINGGINVPLVLGSTSTYTYAKMGGYKGRNLMKGDVLNLHAVSNNSFKKIEKLSSTRIISQPCIIPCLYGPEYDLFSNELKEQLENTIFKINAQSNRMGYRLDLEQPMTHKVPEIISSGTVRGTIQLPTSGNPIVLMADSPTTGGYPRIANCTEEGTDLLAQCKPGDSIIFQMINNL